MKNNIKKQPKLAEWILYHTLGKNERDTVLGDFEEFYDEIRRESGLLKASLWYWLQVIKSLPRFITNSAYWRTNMLKNYFTIAVRNIKRQKVYSAINIVGLAIGFTCSILIYLYVMDELSWDDFHVNGDWLYRVIRVTRYPDGSLKERGGAVWIPLGEELTKFFPEIKYQTRYEDGKGILRYKNKIFSETIHMVDTPFFEMFTFPLISGNSETVLSQDNSIILTQSYAGKYFGDENPIGKIITCIFGQERKDYIVTGIVKDLPRNSNLRFNVLMNTPINN